VILHFQPLEGYPPIQNILSFFSGKDDLKVICCSTRGNFDYSWDDDNVVVHRFGLIGSQISTYRRLLSYVFYNLATLFKLIVLVPERVLYIESLSAWPAIIYKKFFNSKAKLFIHYHEYTTPREYAQGMKLAKYFHSIEKKWYTRTSWISHTNKFRLDKFIEDEGLEEQENKIFHVMPNYPPLEWKNHSTVPKNDGTVRLVYVGYSISFDSMNAKELCDWVLKHEGVELHCYFHKPSVDLESYVVQEETNKIQTHQSIPYNYIPAILSQYDIGVMLYKGSSDNYKYNATNKLFEYLACGLDVWFPKHMLGAMEYVCEDASPRVLALDFERLDHYSLEYLLGEGDLPCRETNYFCEPIYKKLYRQLII
jgi:hypothetical protein